MNHKIHTYLAVDTDRGTVLCTECDYELCEAEDNYKNHSLCRIRPISEAGKYFETPDWLDEAEQIEFRQFHCPECATLFDYEIALEEMDFLHDIDVKIEDIESFRASE